ncbi:hypothetical protein PoB_000204400 [Plakobranchus ocellatus]|uniref:Uncharacterized protein n=1 Tax=Plakobranchus ocellatus TaxID=259542 RepID=A0AAV3XXF6_9GAST|nr:hypothetical protein PoB_000204400 [Plakobranchus ocellatus]
MGASSEARTQDRKVGPCKSQGRQFHHMYFDWEASIGKVNGAWPPARDLITASSWFGSRRTLGVMTRRKNPQVRGAEKVSEKATSVAFVKTILTEVCIKLHKIICSHSRLNFEISGAMRSNEESTRLIFVYSQATERNSQAFRRAARPAGLEHILGQIRYPQ